MLVHVDLGHATREQAVRLMLRGEVEGAELESLAAEHNIALDKKRCVMYFYSAQTTTEDASAILEGVIDPENDVLTEVGRHSLALMKALDEEANFDALAELTRAVENSFLMETGQPVYIGVSQPRDDLSLIAESFEEARNAINIAASTTPPPPSSSTTACCWSAFCTTCPPTSAPATAARSSTARRQAVQRRDAPHHRDLL